MYINLIKKLILITFASLGIVGCDSSVSGKYVCPDGSFYDFKNSSNVIWGVPSGRTVDTEYRLVEDPSFKYPAKAIQILTLAREWIPLAITDGNGNVFDTLTNQECVLVNQSKTEQENVPEDSSNISEKADPIPQQQEISSTSTQGDNETISSNDKVETKKSDGLNSLGWWGKLVNAVIGIRELTDENAMLEIYGNYKKNTPVGSNWLVENAPSDQKSELGKTKYVAPLTDYSYKSSKSDFKVFLTYAVDLNESGLPDDCHACSVVIGSHVFKKGFLGWKQYSSEKFLDVGGSWGRPPQVSVNFDSKKNLLVLHIVNSFFGQGISETSSYDISFDGNSWKSGEVTFETSGPEDEAVSDPQENISGSTEAEDPNSTYPNDIPVAEVPDTKDNVTESTESPVVNNLPPSKTPIVAVPTNDPYTLKAYITDRTGTLTNKQIEELDGKLTDFEKKTKHQMAIMLVDSTFNESIDSYSLKVANTTGIGRKGNNDGILVLLAIKDRKVRISVGDGLKSILTDQLASEIIAQSMSPKFKNGEYYDGISDGITSIINALGG
ncbi:MAG: TPM domain-containing protein [Methylotenera sp.]|nr:TPM domain-containing protein [Methylotenera sp.]MDP3094015.1 TPM domain-containing protein [Methylotenera sp.]